MASLVSVFPWLVPFSKYKAVTFTVTALLLCYSWIQVKRVTQCDIADAKQLKWQKGILWFASILLVISIFSAYGFVPLINWLESI